MSLGFSKGLAVLGAILGSTAACAQIPGVASLKELKAVIVLPVLPALPGEEQLSAQERGERDFLMPSRRQRRPIPQAPSGTTKPAINSARPRAITGPSKPGASTPRPEVNP